MKRIEVEICLAVADYLGKLTTGPDGRASMPGHDAAFKNAANDAEGAMSAAREHAYYELDASEAAQIKTIEASYLETDSSNPTHASAHFKVLIDVPEDIADKVEAAFSSESCSPSP
jgi:hypothetical protein